MSLEKNLRQHGLKLFVVAAATVCVLGLITFHSVDAASPQQAKLVAASAPVSQSRLAPKIPAPGTAIYETHRGDTVISVSRHYLSQSSYLTSSQLAEAIRGAPSVASTNGVKGSPG